MRQVPRYLIIGSGRMARHFQHYLNLLNIPFVTWARRYNTSEELLLSCRACSNILLLINDTEIENFTNKHPFLKEKVLVHFSGQLSLEDVYSAHPLMTFGNALYDLKTYQDVAFILEENGLEMREILPGLANQNFKISRQLKAYYHALCVMSGNFTCILWEKFFNEIENRFSIPKSAVFPYLERITKNLIENPGSALTGPLIRKDVSTIQANLAALQTDEFEAVYRAFVTVFHKRSAEHESA